MFLSKLLLIFLNRVKINFKNYKIKLILDTLASTFYLCEFNFLLSLKYTLLFHDLLSILQNFTLLIINERIKYQGNINIRLTPLFSNLAGSF